MHQFINRSISPDNSRVLKVIRIICDNNFKKRKGTGEKLPYTITILPGFLIPYSRVPLPDIYKANDEYLCGRKVIQQEAALIMKCQSRHSFRLYYKRICSLTSKWIIFLSTIFPKVIEKEVSVDIRKKWEQFKGILKALKVKSMEEISDSAGLHRRFEYAHNTLFYKNIGLGP